MTALFRGLVARLPTAVREPLFLLVARARERRLRRGGARVGLVLVYHRTGPAAGDPDRELDPAFPVDLLRRQLRHLRRSYSPVAAADVLEAAASRALGEPFPVAVTLDDDLRSHVHVAAPVLRELAVPATAFLTGAPQSAWWDDLQRAVESGRLGPEDVPEAEPALVADTLAGRPRAIRRLARTVEALPPSERDELAGRLRQAAGTEGSERSLSAAEAWRAGLAVGFHTLRHYDLRTLDDEQLATALTEGREAEESLTLIAYPHGKCDDRIVAAARAAGFEQGFTGEAKAVSATDDPLRLGRLQPTRGSLGEFALQLTAALRSAAG